MTGLESARRAFAERMQKLAVSKEDELTRLRAQVKTLSAAPPPPPKKIVVDDTEPAKKPPAKKKVTKPKTPATTTGAPTTAAPKIAAATEQPDLPLGPAQWTYFSRTDCHREIPR